ncbi:RNA polymerase II transcription mediator complex subunit 9-domain-containing protein [Dendryphion nanum]|uniref:Mediator of RNA polymerase II transcription subunit 9 n=1 Tax=Dendryphion nanum TaxID=256645 RepID=A0A9P9EH97_9PLEO|nr:RNA polymerase II transcription mediator complex subunit 9-domain-containing protein [Dendryphion nanum]
MSAPVTPHAPISARASLPPTGSATPALPPQPSVPALPPPATFDILPDLHRLLNRLLAASTQAPAPTPTPGQPVDDDGPLDLKNLASEAQKLRNKIQRAQRAVMALPDIDRTTEDQEEEIEHLEARIAGLKAALQGLGQPVKHVEEEDTSMTG